ncbi:retrovirus-related Pol polyprotein from transposon 412 [Trichonephila clavipes]|nr:retrovirus-related Pol polyprotein from transposon 412 [Trichonephila clavipes]
MKLTEKLISKNHRDEFSATSERPSTSPTPLRLTLMHFPDVIPASEKKSNPTRQCSRDCVPVIEIPEISHVRTKVLPGQLASWDESGRFRHVERATSDRTNKKRAPSELVDHFLDSWDGFKEAKSLAEKLDHIEAIRRVHKKTGPMKTWERRTFDKKPLESKNKSAHFSDRVCLRDSGSSIDVGSRSWINENDLLGEHVWLKSPLDEICHCLPLAKIKIKTKKGEFFTKAAIKQESSDNDLYLLGNRTAEMLESNDQGVQMINAVVTKREANSLVIPAFEGEEGKSLAEVNGVEFKGEQRKCPDMKPLWDKDQTGIDKEFRFIRGN